MSRLRLIDARNQASKSSSTIYTLCKTVNRRRLLQSFIASPVIFTTSSDPEIHPS